MSDNLKKLEDILNKIAPYKEFDRERLFGENPDDAFDKGVEHGREELADDIRQALGLINKKD